jgi:AAHS family benzoate transporter-like MFS transporter
LQVSFPAHFRVIFFGFFAMVFDAYDVIVYGATVPALLAYPGWSLTPAQVGAIGAAALFGMVFGAPASGWLSDRFGRRKVLICLLAWFSTMMLMASWASTPELLGTFRFLAGLGFGGIPPTALALTTEFAPKERRALFNSLTMAGFGIGAMLAGGLSVALLQHIGFRGMYAIGGLPLFTLVPLAIWLLPESPSFRRDPTRETSGQPAASPWSGVLRGKSTIATASFAAALFFIFFVVYGLNTWLTQLLRGVGLDINVALKLLILLNGSAIIGSLGGGWIADRVGLRSVSATSAIVVSVCLVLLATMTPPLAMITMLVFVTGVAIGGAQGVLWTFLATYYEPSSRASALGLCSGVGRLGAAAAPLVVGIFVGGGMGLAGNFLVLAGAAVLAALATAGVPRRPVLVLPLEPAPGSLAESVRSGAAT